MLHLFTIAVARRERRRRLGLGADVQANSNPRRQEREGLLLRRLLPPGDPVPVASAVESLKVREPDATAAGRPYVMLNMVSTVDGRASIAGRSGPLGNRADRELFHGLRSTVDAVMAGAGTVRTERYGRIIRDERSRHLRRERGLSEEPLACIVSASLSLAPDIPLLADTAARVAIVTSSAASLPQAAAQVDYVRAERDGLLDLSAALGELHERLAVRTLLCEGGPHLNAQLLLAGLVDELFLSLSPRLVGADPTAGEALRIIAGAELEPPVELELLGALESDSQLFLRYGVRVSAAERVSRETTLKSSLAS
jgi:riboflavin-specific deaminase-like protein